MERFIPCTLSPAHIVDLFFFITGVINSTQMAYIPLDDESKIKGKAAIEVLGSRIGKSGGSLVQQLLVLIFGTVVNAAPVLVVLYYLVLGWWAYSAHRLSSLFYARTATQEHNKED